MRARTSAPDPDQLLPRYEGLIGKTAQMYAGYTGAEYDDVRQELALKAWRAIGSFDPKKWTASEDPLTALDGFVFMAIKNRAKDLAKVSLTRRKYPRALSLTEVGQTGGGLPNTEPGTTRDHEDPAERIPALVCHEDVVDEMHRDVLTFALTGVHRTVAELFVVGGMTRAQIAAAAGVTTVELRRIVVDIAELVGYARGELATAA